MAESVWETLGLKKHRDLFKTIDYFRVLICLCAILSLQVGDTVYILS